MKEKLINIMTSKWFDLIFHVLLGLLIIAYSIMGFNAIKTNQIKLAGLYFGMAIWIFNYSSMIYLNHKSLLGWHKLVDDQNALIKELFEHIDFLQKKINSRNQPKN